MKKKREKKFEKIIGIFYIIWCLLLMWPLSIQIDYYIKDTRELKAIIKNLIKDTQNVSRVRT